MNARPRDRFSEFDDDAGPIGAPVAPKEREEMVPKSRLDEVLADRNRLAQDREELIQSMLVGGARNQEQPEAPKGPSEDDILNELSEPVFPDDTPADIRKAVEPIFRANNRAVAQRMLQRVQANVDERVQPMEERNSYAEIVDRVRSRIEGFDDVREDIARAFSQMAPEEQAKYNSELGLEVLAERALKQRSAAPTQRSGMAHSVPSRAVSGGGSRGRSGGPTPADIHAMSDEDFEAFLASKGAAP